jgi:hypothetical protein
MNCPHHIMIFRHSSAVSRSRSHRGLGKIYRYERSVLTGPATACGMTLNDAHILPADQIRMRSGRGAARAAVYADYIGGSWYRLPTVRRSRELHLATGVGPGRRQAAAVMLELDLSSRKQGRRSTVQIDVQVPGRR